MEDYTKRTLKLSELKSFRKEIFEKLYEENKQEILAKVKDEYKIYDDKLAANIFEAGGSISYNGFGDEEEEKAMYSKSRYLLLSLPVKDGEENQRQREYTAFVKDLKDPDLATPDDVKVVKTRESMFQCISHFLQKKDEAFTNVIVFNGHGADGSKDGGQGLCFADEEQNFPLDDVIREIIKCGKPKLGYVQIIFAQCFAHLHSAADDITIIYFTSRNKPYTDSLKSLGMHIDLQKLTTTLGEVAPGEYLLLAAPLENNIAWVKEKEQRQKEFEHFIALLDVKIRPNPQPEPVFVTNWGLMLGAIKCFLEKRNRHNVIIFNGRGGPKGLFLAERTSDDPLPLNYVVRQVANLIKKLKLKQQVQLAFAQNYGHLYTEYAKEGLDNFQVIPLSTKVTPSEYLFLSAPIKAQEKDDRRKQFEHFVGALDDEIKPNPHPEPVVVTNWDLMLGAIKYFLGKRNRHNVIIFNGRGGPKGLFLAESDDPLDLNYVVRQVANVIKNLKLKQQVQLVFAQKYGHLYTEDAKEGLDNLQVISFTDEQNPKTFSKGGIHFTLKDEYVEKMNNLNTVKLEIFANDLNSNLKGKKRKHSI